MASVLKKRTLEEIFLDYRGRYRGLVRALTTDADELYTMCDPDIDNFCLYGYPDESWKVSLPSEDVPPEIPEPTLGIFFPRDSMKREKWLMVVAAHSDCWLLAVAFFLGKYLDRYTRNRLFGLINNLPTLLDVVREAKNKPSANVRSNPKISVEGRIKSVLKVGAESLKEDDREPNSTLCGKCRQIYSDDEFWIACDFCDKWYHGNCVNITPVRAESIKKYKCLYCSMKQYKRQFLAK